MPSILLPEIIKQQARLERQLARQRRGEVGQDDGDFVVEWYCKRMKEQGGEEESGCLADPASYQVWSFKEFYEYVQDCYGGVPDRIWNYFDLATYITDLTETDDNYTLVFYDPEEQNPAERIFTFGEVGQVLPAWNGRQHEWFSEHPFKHNFYVLHYEG